MISTIASERRRLHMTQADLGDKLGKSRTTISRWEQDASHIEAENLLDLCMLFGCSIEYILGLTTERTPQAID